MVVITKPTATDEDTDDLADRLRAAGLSAHRAVCDGRVVFVADGERDAACVESHRAVERVAFVRTMYKLASREFRPEDTIVSVDGQKIGARKVIVMAGPCAVESVEQMIRIGEMVKARGATFLRGGAYKPHTTPYRFQGHGEDGLKMLIEAKQATGLSTVTEVLDQRDVERVHAHTDMLQIGARNMQNFALLKDVGRQEKPVLLKRGMSATIEDWLLAAEYVLAEGNPNVVLCERGIRTYETHTRFTFDLNAVPAAKGLSHLPVIADPSHGTGRRELVVPMARAAVAAGADGLMVEVHHDPENSMTGDGKQTLHPDQFARLMDECRRIAVAIGREF